MRRLGIILVAMAAAGVGRAATSLYYQDYDTIYERGAFLTRGAGARPTAMGGAFTAVADDASAAAWNPGGLGQIGSLSAVAQYDAIGLGMAASFLSVAMPVGSAVGAVTVQMMSYGTLQYRDGSGAKTGTGSPVDVAASQTWAFRSPSWLGGAGWTGIGVELLQEAEQDALFGLNFGELVPLSPRISMGWTVQHLGGDDDSWMPTTLRLGTAYHGDRLNAAMDLGYGLIDQLMTVGIGGEVRVHPAVVLRLGYRWEGRDQVQEGIRGVSAGAGFKLGDFAVDYAYQPFGDLATSHRISVEYRMPKKAAPAAGPKRKEPSVKVMPALPGLSDEGAAPRPAAKGTAVARPAAAPAAKPVGTVAPAATGTAAAATASPRPDRIPDEPPARTTTAPPTVAPLDSPEWAVSSTPAGDGSSLLPPPDELQTPPEDEGGLLSPRGRTATPDGESQPSFGAPRRGGGP